MEEALSIGNEKDAENQVWIVAAQGNKAYIGQIYKNPTQSIAELKNRVIDGMKLEPIALVNAYELIVDSHFIPTQQGMGKVDVCFLRPVDNCLHGVRIYLLADRVHFFADMSEDSQRRNKKMVDDLQQQLQAARLKESGLVLATGGTDLGQRPRQ
jgi:hypothetical protein